MTSPETEETEDVAHLVDSGLLFELNRRVLHPLGLALVVEVDEEGGSRISPRLLRTDDPTGFVFPDADLEDGFRKYGAFMRVSGFPRLAARYASLGYRAQVPAGLGDVHESEWGPFRLHLSRRISRVVELARRLTIALDPDPELSTNPDSDGEPDLFSLSEELADELGTLPVDSGFEYSAPEETCASVLTSLSRYVSNVRLGNIRLLNVLPRELLADLRVALGDAFPEPTRLDPEVVETGRRVLESGSLSEPIVLNVDGSAGESFPVIRFENGFISPESVERLARGVDFLVSMGGVDSPPDPMELYRESDEARGRLIEYLEALDDALTHIRLHDRDYHHVTPPELISRIETLLSGPIQREVNRKVDLLYELVDVLRSSDFSLGKCLDIFGRLKNLDPERWSGR